MTNPSSSTLPQAAATMAGGQEYPAAALYVVATPIGNLADFSLRAIHVLCKVDAIACEDTRHSGPMLRQLGIDKPLLALHEHNERQGTEGVLQRLARGERVAYISDAGTPAISDPGALLVAGVQAAGYRAVPIPGASSVLAALSVAGIESGGPFRFIGFLPPGNRDREKALGDCVYQTDTQVLFEAPHRIESLCADLARLCPERRISICRELTKQFESVHTLRAQEAPSWLAEQSQRSRGEFVIVLHGLSGSASVDDAQTDAAQENTLQILLRELPLKQAVALTAEITGAPRNKLYARALEIKAIKD